MLRYPVYGEDAPEYYDSLVLRSGQDYPATIFRDELFTSLCRELSDSVLAQRDKFCILYINGRYWGIYCMKEAFSETMYATNYGVSQSSVEMAQAPVSMSHDIFQLIRYCGSHNMSDPEIWEYVSSWMDVDSLIDWMIMEGYSANSDIGQNLRYFRSTENGNAWQFAYYDIDWGWYFNIQFSNVLTTGKGQHMTLTRNFMKNPEFREKFLTRLSEALATTLSDEHVISRIDYYAELLDPEVPRERSRWGGTYKSWQLRVEAMKKFLADGHIDKIISVVRSFAKLTPEEMETYFGGWLR